MGLIIGLFILAAIAAGVKFIWKYCTQFVVRTEPTRGRYSNEPGVGVHVYLNRRVNDSPGLTIGRVNFTEEDAEKKIQDLKVEGKRKAKLLNGKKIK